MALSKSDKSGSNVTNLDDARVHRANSSGGSNRKNAPDEDQDNDTQLLKPDDESDDNPAKTTQKVSNRRFDKVKVERIKGEIARGEYKIDYLHVADKFIEHERFS